MKNIAILGSTGSIGTNALKVIEANPDKYRAVSLGAGRNVKLLLEQMTSVKPKAVSILEEHDATYLKERLFGEKPADIYFGPQGFIRISTLDIVDTVISAVTGAAGLLPTFEAIRAGKNIALANKETMVMAGPLVMEEARRRGVTILPVDSEHSAILQSLQGHPRKDVKRVILTASGGPFRDYRLEDLENVTTKQALNHPNWEMGEKISIDSATMMNKGLEAIEAKCLFDISQEKIEVVVHPQSVIHSMVSFKDGTVMAQLGIPDMKGAIAYAMAYPERLALKQPTPDFVSIGKLTFEKPDMKKFPCLALAYAACETGRTLPAVLNAANEMAVAAFLEKSLSFIKIPEVIEKTMEHHAVVNDPTLSDILEADQWARKQAQNLIKTLYIFQYWRRHQLQNLPSSLAS